MCETEEPTQMSMDEAELDYSKIAPTEEQLKISLANCRLIYDPENKMENELLYKHIDNGSLQYGKITLMSFIANTIDQLMAGIEDKNFGEPFVKMCCEYLNSPYHWQEHQFLSSRIFEVVLTPVPLFENAGFVQVWCDISQCACQFKETQIECLANNFDPYEFPNIILAD